MARVSPETAADFANVRPFDPGWAEEIRPAPAPLLPLVGFKVSALSGLEVPEREWHIEGIMPARNITLFMANGGDGKSLLALQLAVATAVGGRWLGRQCKVGQVLYLSAEDDREEVHRRLKDISCFEDIPLAGLGAIEVLPLVGEDVVLVVPDKAGQMVATPFFGRLIGALDRVRPSLLILDTSADVFGGDEIKKVQVRQFLSMLRGLCVDRDMAILLLGHPSQSGMGSGQGTSGNVAWSNSVRSRWYMERLFDEKVERDPLARILKVMKTNYGPPGEAFNIRWQQGVFVLDGKQALPMTGPVAAAHTEAVFIDLLRLLNGQHRNVTSIKGSTYAPKMFSEHPDARGIKLKALETAMEGLLKTHRIELVWDGPSSRRRSRLVVVDPAQG